MFVHMSIHRPKPGKEELLIDSMHRFGAAMQGADGFQWAHALKDETRPNSSPKMVLKQKLSICAH